MIFNWFRKKPKIFSWAEEALKDMNPTPDEISQVLRICANGLYRPTATDIIIQLRYIRNPELREIEEQEYKRKYIDWPNGDPYRYS